VLYLIDTLDVNGTFFMMLCLHSLEVLDVHHNRY
jgi:hypothetical protein